MNTSERVKAQVVIENLMFKIYNELRKIEIIENKNILLAEDVVPYVDRYKVDKKFGVLFEPFLFADTFGFTVYRNSISKSRIFEIFYNCKEELDIKFEFHINNLYYETNDYGEGGKKFF